MSSIKYVFIVNPHAGRGIDTEGLRAELDRFFSEHELQYEVYLTRAAGDAITFARDYPLGEDEVCFVACGGDGTFNEVINGGFGRERCSFAIYPCGSGNDYIKAFGGRPEDFRSLPKLVSSELRHIDVLNCGGRLCANMCNIGLDSIIAERMVRFKHIPGVSGPMAYKLSTLLSVLGHLGVPMELSFDDGEHYKEELTLSAFGNGICYGGGFFPTPEASVMDGLIDFCGVRKVGLTKISKLIGRYKAGKHLHDPAFDGLLITKRCRHVKIESPVSLVICLDGEIFRHNSIDIDLLESALPLRLPEIK